MSEEESEFSDFSDYEDENPTTSSSPVFLGYTDGPVQDTDSVGPFDNCAGGQPIWLHRESPADKSLYTCQNCKRLMKMLVQVYAPLEDTVYDRCIYVFACTEPKCRRVPGSVRAFRGILRDAEREKQNQKQPFEQTLAAEPAKLFDFSSSSSNDNPFASATASVPKPAPAASKSNSSSSKKANSTPNSKQQSAGVVTPSAQKAGPEFPKYHMVVEDEILEKPKTKTASSLDPSIMDKDIENDGEEGGSSTLDSSSGTGDLEAMAKSLNMDPAFQHFVDITECNPDQIVRYANPLSPLFYSSKDKVYTTIRNNEIPGARKVELQVMPQLIMELEDEQDLADGMEWGTILVATSIDDSVMPSLDDNGVGYIEEWVGVQWEEEIALPMRK